MIFGTGNRSRKKIDLLLVAGVEGALIMLIGLALLLPLPIALWDGEPIWWVYPAASAIAFAIGGGLFHFFRPREELRAREAFMVVALTWLVLSAFCALPFMLSGALTYYADAFFEAMSGLTTTGATVFGGTTPYGTLNEALAGQPRSILLWRSLTHFLGGMGFIVLSVAVLPFLNISGGSQLFQAESSTPSSDKLTPRVQDTAAWLWGVYSLLTFALFLLLWLHPGMDAFDALNHAMSTIATGGFSTRDNSLAYYDSVYIDGVVTVFMFLSGLSFALHFRMLRGEWGMWRRNREAVFYTWMTLAAVVAVSLGLWLKEAYGLAEAFRYGAFQVVSIITTTGFATADYEIWPSITILILFLLFFTGGCAGSTAGGIKSFRILILIKNAMREIRQTVHPTAVLPVQIGKRTIDPATIRRVLSFVISYVFFFSLGAFVLTALGIDFDSAIWASISCLGNVGPALGDFGPVDNYASMPWLGKWMMSLLMMIGRLEVFTVLVLFSKAYWRE